MVAKGDILEEAALPPSAMEGRGSATMEWLERVLAPGVVLAGTLVALVTRVDLDGVAGVGTGLDLGLGAAFAAVAFAGTWVSTVVW